jgi:uncharacterized protein YeaO (DUF488 family)
MTEILLKRAYEPPAKSDGKRVLVERLWPRGVKKEALHLDAWMKDVAPSTPLRKWFNHDPEKWNEFRKRYFAELRENPETWHALIDNAPKRQTLVYSSHDQEHNNAVALREFLEKKLRTAKGDSGARKSIPLGKAG